MNRALRAILAEDSESDAKLIERELRKSFDLVDFAHVEDRATMEACLKTKSWDIVLSDWTMPSFGALAVLDLLRELGAETPLIIISGTIGEEVAVEGLRAGAWDYLLKDRLTRLAPAIRRVLDEVQHLALRRETEAQLYAAEAEGRRLLKAQEARFRALVEKSRDAIAIQDQEGCFVYLSPSAERIFGRPSSELLGKTWQELAHAEDRVELDARLMDLMSEPGGSAALEHRVLRPDGQLGWVQAITTNLLGDPNVAGIVSNIRDISERKRADLTLKRVEEQLRQAQKLEAIGLLAGGVAHDFNNLLSAVLSYSDMLIAELRPGDPMFNDVVEIKRAGERAAELTRQLLAFSRQQVLQPKIVYLDQTVSGLERLLRRVIGEDLEFTILTHPNLASVLVDPGQAEQVIMNLAVNARDAMPDGGKLTIETANVDFDDDYAVAHAGVSVGPHVMLAVSDTGVGMDLQTQSRIFEPFFTTKEQGKGTGLGLSTVFGIVKQSGGSVWLYSEPGQGATFKIYFPVAERPLVVDSPEPKDVSTDLSGAETILLVEDDDRVRVLAVTILRRRGYHVLEARSGGDALLICEQHGASIQLLLTDVVMPRMSGRQLVERLRVVRPGLKVLYMSGYTNNTIVHHGVLDSDVAFIQKPITPDALARKVREVLDEN